ncbi:hypothetical protein NDU88_006092 [Pleurodeles waltl]|uniref:Uncharacterized protein n=1 Tax=Pleurodeles waltl TaxID=8319 RepID=A0AAV7N2F8_PLEWA|nr:hypothetical protein NDU88_006092 [Pleurodeles waltl]
MDRRAVRLSVLMQAGEPGSFVLPAKCSAGGGTGPQVARLLVVTGDVPAVRLQANHLAAAVFMSGHAEDPPYVAKTGPVGETRGCGRLQQTLSWEVGELQKQCCRQGTAAGAQSYTTSSPVSYAETTKPRARLQDHNTDTHTQYLLFSAWPRVVH